MLAVTVGLCKCIHVRIHIYVAMCINAGLLWTCPVLLGSAWGWWHSLYANIKAGKPGCDV